MSKAYERTLEETPTWAVAAVCFVLLAISITIEHIIHVIGKWFKKKHNYALYESLEKVKGELMLLGFISLLLTVFQGPISTTCISEKVAATWHPCASPKAKTKKPGKESDTKFRKLLEFSDPTSRRFLATKGYDKCKKNDEVALMSTYGIHQLHIFIFVLAIFHILQCIITLALGRTKMRKWKKWEDESKTVEYQSHNDQTRFRFTRDTTFGRRHLNTWSQSSISLWVVSFFRQFFVSVNKVDYLALRHGFILAHLTPESEAKFDFHEYIQRSLEEDFKVVVGISPILWFFAVLILLTNTHGWYPYLWLPFIPLIIILLVGAKLQMIITKMGLKIQERGEVVRGAPVVEPRDELFWFKSPRFLLNLIHFVLFQNAFQLAFFAWTSFEFTIRSCFHKTTVDTVLRLTMGILIQVLCSYVTLPLYALVTQMGSSMKHTIFKEGIAAALKEWHHTAKKRVKDSKHSYSDTPSSSMSSVQLKHKNSSLSSTCENEHWDVEGGGSPYPNNNPIEGKETQMQVLTPTSAELPLRPSEISVEQPHFDRDLG